MIIYTHAHICILFQFFSNLMARKSTTELFEHYCTALVYLLPIKDTEFIEELLKHDLLPGDLKIKLESMTVHYERSSYFLDSVIKPQLAVGDHKGFVNLLTIMKNCKYDNVKDLAKRVDEELAVYIKLKCKVVIIVLK